MSAHPPEPTARSCAGSGQGHDRPLSDLIRAVSETSREDLPALLGHLESVRAVAWTRMLTVPPAARAGESDEPHAKLLTVEEAAAVLGVRAGYVYTAVRQRRIPTVRLPGLDKGGRTCEGKYVRIAAATLRRLMAAWEEPGVDGGQGMATIGAARLRAEPAGRRSTNRRRDVGAVVPAQQG